jgi:ABC-type multidrug transport system fused ATPase/permease subunit
MKILQSLSYAAEAFSNLTEQQGDLSGIRVIKSFVQEEKETERFRKANEATRAPI